MAETPLQLQIDARRKNLIDVAIDVLGPDRKFKDDAGPFTYVPRLLGQLSLPAKDPGDLLEWSRRNNEITMAIVPGIITAADGTRQRAFPFGVLARELLCYLTTQAILTKQRQINLGDNFAAFLRRLGYANSGTNRRRVLDQAHRLAAATIQIEDRRQHGVHWKITGSNTTMISKYELWIPHQPTPNSPTSTVILSEEFYKEITKSPIRIPTLALKALKGSALRFDLCVWLQYRSRNLRRPTLISWTQLADQLGANYRNQRAFKAQILKHLEDLQFLFPQGSVVPSKTGLRLTMRLRHGNLVPENHPD